MKRFYSSIRDRLVLRHMPMVLLVNSYANMTASSCDTISLALDTGEEGLPIHLLLNDVISPGSSHELLNVDSVVLFLPTSHIMIYVGIRLGIVYQYCEKLHVKNWIYYTIDEKLHVVGSYGPFVTVYTLLQLGFLRSKPTCIILAVSLLPHPTVRFLNRSNPTCIVSQFPSRLARLVHTLRCSFVSGATTDLT